MYVQEPITVLVILTPEDAYWLVTLRIRGLTVLLTDVNQYVQTQPTLKI